MTHTHLDPDRAANLAENPYAGHGAVLLDIGGDIGAVVLHLTAMLEGAEVEIESADHHHDHHRHDHTDHHHHDHGGHTHRPHVAVLGRPAAGGPAYTAVFPELQAGGYALSIPGEEGRLLVEVRGGEVQQVSWPRV